MIDKMDKDLFPKLNFHKQIREDKTFKGNFKWNFDKWKYNICLPSFPCLFPHHLFPGKIQVPNKA